MSRYEWAALCLMGLSIALVAILALPFAMLVLQDLQDFAP